ncbi:hypothetical protein MAPG_01457 [Magnaporthiopsis poae ATCC 64411]|uniref:Uncharacterized protein n=1 Tax=Magnaporthiopsis poae (strain ATCC 64411 / 73-15) TaxID=644358 RepID=A0A0C4DNR3_MAGP6|nr:hypothetical protein MAPG_01457 [Magnaporthiopsis poae ATCC 64411]
MPISMASFKKFAIRVSKAVVGLRRNGPRRANGQKSIRGLDISHPTNFRRERTSLHGFNQEQLALLREKELARRVGVMDPDSLMPGRPTLSIPLRPAGGPMSSNPVVPGTVQPEEAEIEPRKGIL